MFFMPRRRKNNSLDIWPGFVDAISTLLLVIIFVLMAFVLAQFYLTDDLSNKDQALSHLNSKIGQLETSLHDTTQQRNTLEEEIRHLKASLDEFMSKLKIADDKLASTTQELVSHQTEKATLKEQLKTLEEKLQQLTDTLITEKAKTTDQEGKLADLTTQLEKLRALNVSLTDENEKIKGGIGNYRSEFFAKLKEAIGDRADIRVVGDRFVFQSEVLFDMASADLGEEGKKQLQPFIKTLKDISQKIPPNVQWILRIDGHTDHLPIHTKFPSNWELSAARAISVVKHLIDQGIPAQRLVAAGFGEHQPLEEPKDLKPLAKNRRIEFKLDHR